MPSSYQKKVPLFLLAMMLLAFSEDSRMSEEEAERVLEGRAGNIMLDLDFNEETGASTFYDTSYQSNDAFCTNCPTVGEHSKAQFDGVNDRLYMSDHPNLDFSLGDFAIDMHVYMRTVAKDIVFFDKTENGVGGYGLVTSWNSSVNLSFIRGDKAADGVASNNGIFTADRWHHVVINVDSSAATDVVTFYVNNVNQGSANLAAETATNAANLYIGDDNGNLALGFLNADIARFRIYNSILSRREVAASYHLGEWRHRFQGRFCDGFRCDVSQMLQTPLDLFWARDKERWLSLRGHD